VSLVVRGLLYAALIPGTVVVLIPRLIVGSWGRYPAGSGPWYLAGLAMIAAGGSILVWCIWDFAWQGRGTLAPVDPPRELVVRGLYRYVRNPMYLGALIALGGQVIVSRSTALFWYAVGWFLAVHLFVVFYEERTLRRRFGAAYEEYSRTVHRWVPVIGLSPRQRRPR
jgi:protein-S-isoprenylcysteine O-methyltransferase Ste14